MRVVCFFIHGIGTQDQNFSIPIQKGIHKKLTELVEQGEFTDSKKEKISDCNDIIDFQSIYWANIASSEQDNLYRRVYPDLYSEKSFFKKIRQFAMMRSLSMHLIGDIVGYLGKFEGQIKRTVFNQLAAKLIEQAQQRSNFSIIVVAHSLGSVILHDLIYDLQRYKYAEFNSLADSISVFTMGSPISLFELRSDTNLTLPCRKWVNFFHPRESYTHFWCMT